MVHLKMTELMIIGLFANVIVYSAVGLIVIVRKGML